MPPQPAPPPAGAQASSVRSTGSGNRRRTKDRDPASQLSTIEKSVTHLLIATKQLLETLTQWSRHNASESDVSDVYVRLGYEFNIACRAFTTIGVSTEDLGPVPDLLRGILEETLSQEASPQSLDKFLPRIRDIIINLLHGLKKKQSKLRAAKARDPTLQPNGQGVRQTSLQGTTGEEGSLLRNEEGESSKQRMSEGQTDTIDNDIITNGSTNTARTLTGPGRGSFREGNGPAESESSEMRASHQFASPNSSISTTTAENLPVINPEDQTPPVKRISLSDNGQIPGPPPAPKQQDAMTLLQQGGELGRRASRRFSNYQLTKQLGVSASGVPMIPTAQNSPIPNRGRDARESLNAVRARGSYLPSRQKSVRVNESSPSRGTPLSRKISEESRAPAKTSFRTPEEPQDEESPIAKTPEDKLGPSFKTDDGDEKPALSGTVTGPPLDSLSQFPMPIPKPQEQEPQKSREQYSTEEFVPNESPQPGTQLTLFLDYKKKVKKVVLPDGANDLSLARLQLAFIEAFQWNTYHNGVDLPEIYIQDQVSGVRYELEDLSDIKDRTVLVLNVEPLDEVKKHIDESFGGLQKIIDGVRSAVDGQQAAIARVAEKQQETAQEIARISTTPAPPPPRVNGIRSLGPKSPEAHREVASLRRDLASMRQTFTGFTNDVNTAMAAIREKAKDVKATSIDAAVPNLDENSGRAHVDEGKKSLGDDTESIVSRVDNLQDLVEDLRKDVVTRGVRPLPRQLDAINKDIADAIKDLKKTSDFVKRVKPVWTKLWEKELDRICQDRDFFANQQELIGDLETDLEEASNTMQLVEEATKQQSLDAPPPGQANLRSVSRGMPNIDPDVDPNTARDGVLGEVRALQPNHESRLEAIERAEKARRRELEERAENAAFRKELRTFVDEGKRKKSGGVDEIDRQAQDKAERALRQEDDDVIAVKAARAKARAEQRAREAAEAAAAEDVNGGDGAEAGMDGQADGGQQAEAGDNKAVEPVSPKRSSWLPSIFSS